MTSDTPAKPVPRLSPGDRLGPHSVVAFLGADEAGERYEVFFGTTNHETDLLVPPAGAAAPSAADYAAFAAAVAGVRHPCAMRFFAAGEDAAPDGSSVPWLRCERARGYPASRLESPVDATGLPDDGDGPVVPTAGALFAACRGRLETAVRDGVVADVLDGLAHLHSLSLPCGRLDPDEIVLDRRHGLRRPLARIARYAWGAPAGGFDPQADLRGAAAFVRAAASASASVSPAAETARLAAFADALDAGSFESAAAAAAAFGGVVAQNGHADAAARPDADGGDDVVETPPDDPEPRRKRGRRRGPSITGRSEVARRLASLVGIAAVVAFIAAVGVAVYFYLKASAEKERRRVAARLGPPQPAILVIPTERQAEDVFAELPGSVFDYTPEQLELVARAAADRRQPAAAARLAFSRIDEASAEDLPAVFDDREGSVALAVPALRAAAPDDTAAAFLFARAQLLGIGTPRDAAAAWRTIVRATREGLREADLLFGDLLASDVAIPDLRAESRIERDRRAVASWRRAAGPDAAPTHLLFAAADRIAPMLRAGRGIPPVNNDYPQWLARCASAGHVPSLVALSQPGGFAPDDPAEALRWLRVLARAPAADPAWRAWAQFRMAGMFERGEGTPPSASAARKMFERAAEGGNGPAMLAVAARLEKSADPADRTAGAEWRRRAREAGPEPSLHLVSSVVKPPPSYSLRAAARGEAPPPAPEAVPGGRGAPVRTVSLSGDANKAAVLPVVLPDREREKPEPEEAEEKLVPLTDEGSDAARRPPRAPGSSNRKPKHRGGKPAADNAQ